MQEAIESETSKGGQQIKEQLDTLKEQLAKAIEEAQKSEIGRKGSEMSEEMLRSAKAAAEELAKATEKIEKSQAFKAASEVSYFIHPHLIPYPITNPILIISKCRPSK